MQLRGKPPTEHFFTSSSSKVNIPWYVRYRFGAMLILGEFFFALIIGGGLFNWIDFFKKDFDSATINPQITFSFWSILLSMIFITMLFWWFFRKHTVTKLNREYHYHQITHFLRDEIIKLKRISKANSGKLAKVNESSFDLLSGTVNQICNKVRDYYRELLNDQSVLCAIRFSKKNDKSDVEYFTLGRSDGFSAGRDSSGVIAGDEGIPGFFSNALYNEKGVLIYHDLDKAEEKKTYIKTNNDRNFPNDYKTLMVAPINGLDDQKGHSKAMIGLLYITSKEDPFEEKYVDSMCASADLLGATLPQMVDCLAARKKVAS